MHRIERLLNAPLGLKIIKISDIDLAKLLGALIVIDVALLATWTWLSPGPGAVRLNLLHGAGTTSSQLSCTGGNIIGVALLFVYKAILLVYGGILSFRTKDAPGEFSEQRFTTTAIIVVAFAAIVIIPLIYTIETNKVLIASLGVMFSTAVSCGIYTVPKLLQAYDFTTFGFTSGSTQSSMMATHNHSKSVSANSSSISDRNVTCPHCGGKFDL